MKRAVSKNLLVRAFRLVMACLFLLLNICPSPVSAQVIVQMPVPGTLVSLSRHFEPALARGVQIDPSDPFHFNFIITPGQELPAGKKQDEYTKLIKYFLVSLTIPNNDMWVNLSPLEHDRMIPENFARTEMGRDLLSQDYLLKQLMSSLLYPERGVGREFWSKVYDKAREMYGTTDIPVDTFNKVWIIPDKAAVYEKDNTAVVVDCHLKVMLETDYLAMAEGAPPVLPVPGGKPALDISKEVIRTVVLPELEKEVNDGEYFAPLRQVYYSMILATWFKQTLKEGVMGQIYADRSKTAGVEQVDIASNERIYQQYLDAFKKGAFNYIKDDYDALTREMIPRKYFSGGINAVSVVPVLNERSQLTSMQEGAVESVQNSGPDFVKVNVVPSSGHVPVIVTEKPASNASQKQDQVDRALSEWESSVQEKLQAVIKDNNAPVFRSNDDYDGFIQKELQMPIENIDQSSRYGGWKVVTLLWENFAGKIQNGWKNLKDGEYRKAAYDWGLSFVDIVQFPGISPPFVLEMMPNSEDTASRDHISAQNVKGAFSQTFMNKHVRLYPGRLLLSLVLGGAVMFTAGSLGMTSGVLFFIGEALLVFPPIAVVIAFVANRLFIPEGHELSHVLQRAVIKGVIERLEKIEPSLVEHFARNFQKIDLEPNVFYGIGRKPPTGAQARKVVSELFLGIRKVLVAVPGQGAGAVTERAGDPHPQENGNEPAAAPVIASAPSDVGGIDLNADKLDLSIKRDGKGILLPMRLQDPLLLNIPGFIPVVVSIAPLDPSTMPVFHH